MRQTLLRYPKVSSSNLLPAKPFSFFPRKKSVYGKVLKDAGASRQRMGPILASLDGSDDSTNPFYKLLSYA